MSSCSMCLGVKWWDIIQAFFNRAMISFGWATLWWLLHKSVLSTWMKLNKTFLRLNIGSAGTAGLSMGISKWLAPKYQALHTRELWMRLSETWFGPLVPTNSWSLFLAAEAASNREEKYYRLSWPPRCQGMECGSVLATVCWGQICWWLLGMFCLPDGKWHQQKQPPLFASCCLFCMCPWNCCCHLANEGSHG